MNKSTQLCILLILFSLSSCTQHATSNIDDKPVTDLTDEQKSLLKDFVVKDNMVKEIEIKDFDQKLSEQVISDTEYLKLETNPESLIGRIDKIIIKDKKIFILDSQKAKNIFVFDLKGKFLNKVKNIGQGPNEIRSPHDFCVDSQKKEVLVYDQSARKIVYYDYNLVPQRQKKYPYAFRTMTTLPEGKLLVSMDKIYHGFGPIETKFNDLLLLDSEFNVIRKGFPFSEQETTNHFALGQPWHQDNTGIIYTPKFDNSIYKINSNGDINKIFHLDFKDKEVPQEYHTKPMEEMRKFAKSNNKYVYNSMYFETKNVIYMFIRNPGNGNDIDIFYDKASHKYAYGKLKRSSKITEPSVFLCNSLTTYEDKYVTVKEPEFLLKVSQNEAMKNMPDNKYKTLLMSMKEGDNPVLQFSKVSIKNEKLF